MDGAQRKGGLWRLYLESKEARANLLVNKFALKGVQVPVYDKNPFIADNQEDVDASTKLHNFQHPPFLHRWRY